jgi:hypothetical protein
VSLPTNAAANETTMRCTRRAWLGHIQASKRVPNRSKEWVFRLLRWWSCFGMAFGTASPKTAIGAAGEAVPNRPTVSLLPFWNQYCNSKSPAGTGIELLAFSWHVFIRILLLTIPEKCQPLQTYKEAQDPVIGARWHACTYVSCTHMSMHETTARKSSENHHSSSNY